VNGCDVESVEQLETEGIRKDGQRIPVVLTISPLRDSNGKVVNVSTIARDIRERKRAEQNLRESEERLRAILTKAADAILTINQIGIIQSANPAAERMFGYMAPVPAKDTGTIAYPLIRCANYERRGLARFLAGHRLCAGSDSAATGWEGGPAGSAWPASFVAKRAAR
jgi:hypothetical protein